MPGRGGGQLQGSGMVPMEIQDPVSAIDRETSRSRSTRRAALLLCLILLPIAFSLAGIALTFPAAEIAYEIVATTLSERPHAFATCSYN
eukprot:SAG11_NODE_3226_length_2598_cov_3.362145_1_plen_89_part_00